MAHGPRICAACGSIRDVERHHLVPQSLGGTTLPTVWLCATCHRTTSHRLAAVPNHRELTIAGLERAKAAGKRLGGPGLQKGNRDLTVLANAVKSKQADDYARGVALAIEQARSDGCWSLDQIASWLQGRGVPTPRGRPGTWRATTVRRILLRVGQDAAGGWAQTKAERLAALNQHALSCLPLVRQAQREGYVGHKRIALWLTARGVETATGKGNWGAATVVAVLRRIASLP